MKRLLITMVIAMVALTMVWGCGQKADDTGKTPPDVKEAESIDTTRMDSAMQTVDSLVEEGVEAVQEGAEKVGEAVKEVTTH